MTNAWIRCCPVHWQMLREQVAGSTGVLPS